jgi:hypothetical protein
MGKGSKITVKPYLNKTLKSVGMESDGKQYFPLYFIVTYMRRVTKFPVSNLHVSVDKEDRLSEIETVIEYTDIITRILNFEIGRNPDFTVKGLGKKVKTYLSRLAGGTGSILKAYLKSKGLKQGGIGNGHYTDRVGLGMVMCEEKISIAAAELTYILFTLEQFTPTLSVFDFLFDNQIEEPLAILKEKLVLAAQPGVIKGRFILNKYREKGEVEVELEQILKSVCFFLIANDFNQLADLEVSTIEYEPNIGLTIA